MNESAHEILVVIALSSNGGSGERKCSPIRAAVVQGSG